MKKKVFLFVMLFAIVLGGCTLQTSNPTTTPTEQLVGGDVDAHGCKASAGYQWCELKNKCLRIWEEPCENASPTPSVDETMIIKTSIKKALVAKHGNGANELNITVSKIEGNYSSGGASGSGGGGMWFATKVNGQWMLVWDGNGTIFCQDLAPYPDFPASFIPECYDQKTGKIVIR